MSALAAVRRRAGLPADRLRHGHGHARARGAGRRGRRCSSPVRPGAWAWRPSSWPRPGGAGWSPRRAGARRTSCGRRGRPTVLDRSGRGAGRAGARPDAGRLDAVVDVVAGPQVDALLPRSATGAAGWSPVRSPIPVVTLDLRRLYLGNRRLVGSTMHTAAHFATLAEEARTRVAGTAGRRDVRPRARSTRPTPSWPRAPTSARSWSCLGGLTPEPVGPGRFERRSTGKPLSSVCPDQEVPWRSTCLLGKEPSRRRATTGGSSLRPLWPSTCASGRCTPPASTRTPSSSTSTPA